MSGWDIHDRDKIVKDLTPKKIERAQHLLIKIAMPLMRQAWRVGRLESYQPFVKDRIVVTWGRLGELRMVTVFGV